MQLYETISDETLAKLYILIVCPVLSRFECINIQYSYIYIWVDEP